MVKSLSNKYQHFFFLLYRFSPVSFTSRCLPKLIPRGNALASAGARRWPRGGQGERRSWTLWSRGHGGRRDNRGGGVAAQAWRAGPPWHTRPGTDGAGAAVRVGERSLGGGIKELH
jgi:hypothetical protein